MTDDQWADLVGRVRDEYTLLEEYTEQLEDGPGNREVVIFEGPIGRVRVERCNRPIVLGTKTVGSHRIGGEANVVHEYAKGDQSHVLSAYVFKDGDWVEINAANLGVS